MVKELNVAGGIEVVDSAGNVFADLGLPSSEEDILKVALARAFTNVVRNLELTQTETARAIGTDQAEVSKILSGKMRGLSVDRLIRMLAALGRDIDISIAPPPKKRHIMASEHYEIVGPSDKRRAALTPSGMLMLTRWCDDTIPDGFYFAITGAARERMQAIADAINAAIDDRNAPEE
jgi:predicted XRE-type DNA-binding protein